MPAGRAPGTRRGNCRSRVARRRRDQAVHVERAAQRRWPALCEVEFLELRRRACPRQPLGRPSGSAQHGDRQVDRAPGRGAASLPSDSENRNRTATVRPRTSSASPATWPRNNAAGACASSRHPATRRARRAPQHGRTRAEPPKPQAVDRRPRSGPRAILAGSVATANASSARTPSAISHQRRFTVAARQGRAVKACGPACFRSSWR